MGKSALFKLSGICIVMITCCLFVWAGMSVAAEFSADLVVKAQGEQEILGNVKIKGNKMRQEVMDEGEKQTLIVRPDMGVTWMIIPEEKMYMEIPYQSGNKTFEEWSTDKESKAKFLGDETVAGQPCKKYELVEDDVTTYFWVSKKMSFPIKVVDEDTIMEYRNIKEGSVSDSEFDLPQGYEKMSVPVLPDDEESD